MSSMYNVLVGLNAVYRSPDGNLKVYGVIERADPSSPIPILLRDNSGTVLGVDLKDLTILDKEFNRIMSAKEYIDIVNN